MFEFSDFFDPSLVFDRMKGIMKERSLDDINEADVAEFTRQLKGGSR